MKVARRRLVDVETSELRRAISTFRPALRGMRWQILAGCALALITTALELIRPWPVTLVLDRLIAAEDGTPIGVAPLISLGAIAFAVPAALGFTQERLQLVIARVSRKATVRIRSDLFEHIQRLELSEHNRSYSGDLLVRLMGDVNMIRDLLFPSWLNILSRGSLLVGGSIVFLIVDWRLFLVALIPLPLLWLQLDRSSKAVKKAAGKQRKKEGAIAAQAAESIRQVGLIKAFAAEERASQAFKEHARSAERATMAAARHAARMGRMTEVLTGLGVGLVLILGALRVRAGVLSPGELVLVVSYTRLVYKPIRKLTGEGARLAKATACAVRVMELLERPAEVPDRGIAVDRFYGDIEFHGVEHAYEDGRSSIAELNARVPAGSVVAVVGDNGAGKSTTLALLLRLYRPTAGTITIDGVDIDAFSLADYRRCIAYVPQDLSLFSGTLRENLLFGNPDADDQAIAQATRLALLDPVIEALPLGLDTVLDEDGTSLSGGQARRVMLARAALRDASLVLLDEPLAGLDVESQAMVARAIRNIAAGRTTLVVHHGDLSALAPDYRLGLRPRPKVRHLEAVGE